MTRKGTDPKLGIPQKREKGTDPKLGIPQKWRQTLFATENCDQKWGQTLATGALNSVLNRVLIGSVPFFAVSGLISKCLGCDENRVFGRRRRGPVPFVESLPPLMRARFDVGGDVPVVLVSLVVWLSFLSLNRSCCVASSPFQNSCS